MNPFEISSHNFSLSTDEIQTAAAVFTLIFICVFFVSKSFIVEQKKLAWVLTSFNSFVTVVVGILYMVEKCPTYYNFWVFGYDGLKIFHSIDDVSFLSAMWFGLYLLFDLLFGVLFYSKYIGLLTGYFHHVIYMWLMITSTTTNGGFMTTETTFCSTLCFHLIEELPTLILGVGTIFPRWRTDAGFGVTFFVLRIVYHLYMTAYAFVMGVYLPLKCAYVLSMVMHASWFYSWLMGYGERVLREAKNGGKKY